VSHPFIEYRNVRVRRGDTLALDGFSLTIAEGEHVAILGPNGSGKSTLVKTINRECYPLQDGPDSYLRILGEETWNVWDLRAHLGIVSNDLMQNCTRDYSGLEIVVSGFFSSIGVWPHHHVLPHMIDRANAVLELLEASHLAPRSVTEMSSGEARRVLIARALVHDPQALLLDEPSTSLDFRAVHELREALRKIAGKGTSIILVTHNLPDLIPEIERVVLIDRGSVAADGPKDQVLRSTALSDLFRMPLQIVERDGYYQMW
jgi:iron complex transport system ATP-binding protein